MYLSSLALEPIPYALHYLTLLDEGESQKMGAFELTSPLDLLEGKPNTLKVSVSYVGPGWGLTQLILEQLPPSRACHLAAALAWYRCIGRWQKNNRNSILTVLQGSILIFLFSLTSAIPLWCPVC